MKTPPPARIVDQSRTSLSERPRSMRTLRSAACLAFALTLLFAGAAAFAQPAPATTAALATTISPAAPTAGAAPAATTSPAAPMTGTAPATTGSAEAPTTEGAAAAVTPALPPSWTPVQQLAATTRRPRPALRLRARMPPTTGASAADTTPPTTGASAADTIPPETGASAADTTPPTTAPSAAGTTQAAPTPVPPGMVTEAPLPVGPPPAASGHVLNFNEAPIDLVLKYLAESVGLQVVKQSPMADVRVTIIGQQPIYVEDTISLLNSALNVKGYAAIRSGADGRILKIVTLEDAKKLNVPVHKGTQPDLIPTTDEVITQVMPLRYIDATRLRQDLTPLISPSASITSNAAGNSLVVTDTSANVHRIAEIVWALDVNTAGASEVRIYALKNADATSAVKLITDIFKPDTDHGRAGRVLPGHGPVHDGQRRRRRRRRPADRQHHTVSAADGQGLRRHPDQLGGRHRPGGIAGGRGRHHQGPRVQRRRAAGGLRLRAEERHVGGHGAGAEQHLRHQHRHHRRGDAVHHPRDGRAGQAPTRPWRARTGSTARSMWWPTRTPTRSWS